MDRSKDIIFYSNFCTYCKTVVGRLSKLPINDNLIYICVDDKNISLPPFVKAVPTIYLVKDKKIIVDEEIESWISRISNPKSNESLNNDELMAYYGNGSSFSSSYSSGNIPFCFSRLSKFSINSS